MIMSQMYGHQRPYKGLSEDPQNYCDPEGGPSAKEEKDGWASHSRATYPSILPRRLSRRVPVPGSAVAVSERMELELQCLLLGGWLEEAQKLRRSSRHKDGRELIQDQGRCSSEFSSSTPSPIFCIGILDKDLTFAFGKDVYKDCPSYYKYDI